MRKLRSDAVWHTFTHEQQKKIQQWLFDDHLSYQKTHQLMKAELQLSCALSTIGPIYHHLAELRANDALLSIHDAAGQVTNAGVDVEKLRSASETLIAARLFRELKDRASVKEIAALARLTLQSESREIRQTRSQTMLERLQFKAWQSHASTQVASETEVSQSETN
jgi:hypothetical protein